MEVQVRKIKATKAVIQQIPVASLEDVIYHREVLGYCIFPAVGKTPRTRWILFYNKDLEIRKLAHPQSVEIRSFVKGPQVVLRQPLGAQTFQLLNLPEAEFTKDRVNQILKIAQNKKQFYY